jgi:phospholipase C
MASPIKRIVVLMMENHSFDQMLGWMQAEASERFPGIAGVDPAQPRSNPDGPGGAPVEQAKVDNLSIANDPGHDVGNVLRQLADHNQGFVTDFAKAAPTALPAERQEIMGWYKWLDLPSLHFLAYNFVVCDHWFSSVPGPTWPNRFFAHSGTSLGHVDMPEGDQLALHIYDQRTLYDELQRTGVAWRIYHGDFPQSLLLTHQLAYPTHYREFTAFVADVKSGDLPAYVFIEPTYFGIGQNDQHPPQNILAGDNLIGTVYNALQANPGLFNETLLVVLYDEHGGFYDHVEPPPTVAPDAHVASYAFEGRNYTFDFRQLGVRVPAVLVSPWLDHGYLSQTFDHTSLLKMASQLWPGVQPLGARAAQAASPLDHLNWRSAVRPTEPSDLRQDIQAVAEVPPLNKQAQSLFDFSEQLERKIDNPATRAQLQAQASVAVDRVAQSQLAVDRANAFLQEKRVQQLAFATPSSSTG